MVQFRASLSAFQVLGTTLFELPKANRKGWRDCERELYKLRNEIERLFRRLKSFWRIRTRFNRFDVMFCALLNSTLIVEMVYDLA